MIKQGYNKLLSALAIATSVGIGVATPALAQDRLTIGSSPAGGAWYPMAAGIAELVNSNVDGVVVTVEGTGGGSTNPRWLADGTVEMALTTLDMIFAAREGTPPYDQAYDLSGVGSIVLQHSSPSHWVTMADSGIETISDLEGKRLAIGERGAAGNQRALWFLEAHGVDPETVTLEFIGDEQAAGALADGRIDAFVEFVGAPAPSVLNLATTNDIALIEIEEEAAAALRASWPFMVGTEIAGGTYPGVDEPYVGYGVTGTLMALNSVDEETIYQLCMLFIENKEDLLQIHPAFALWGPDPEIETISGQPLHPGARRCYEEQGIL